MGFVMRILLLGSGGREHALAEALRRSPQCSALFAAPGNAGIAEHAECLALDAANPAAVVKAARDNQIDFVVVGPEAPLVAGVVDACAAAGILAFGPTAAAAVVEGSKLFIKDLCRDFSIPTARYARCTTVSEVAAFLDSVSAPYVLKADGLCAGKGVILTESRDEAIEAATTLLGGQFGAASTTLVCEEFLHGEEISYFVLTDGETVVPFGSAQDHKRAFDGDQGPNTGGMGAYSPSPRCTPALEQEILTKIIAPTLKGLKARGISYRGFLFAGLMLTDSGAKLLEYNARLGDPETEVLLPRLETDLLPLLLAAAKGELAGHSAVFSAEHALTVIYASNGYPGGYEKGTTITALPANSPAVRVYHAGTSRAEDGRLLATGGRVLSLTGLGQTLVAAHAAAYGAVNSVRWDEGFYRRDIGWRALDA
jgi:phosphoribosylamine--glycine ligase